MGFSLPMRHYFENPTLCSLTSVFIVTQGLFLSDFSVATLLKKLMSSFCAIALSWIPLHVSECGFFVVCLSAFQIRCYYVSQTGLELCLHASLHLYLGNVQDCFCTPLHPAHLWWFFPQHSAIQYPKCFSFYISNLFYYVTTNIFLLEKGAACWLVLDHLASLDLK